MSPSHCQTATVYFVLVCASTIAPVAGRRDACIVFGSGETEDYVVNIPGAAYTFTGTGNWSSNTVPPATLQAGSTIVIDHAAGGQCILDVPQTVSAGATLTVLTGKNLIIAGELNIK